MLFTFFVLTVVLGYTWFLQPRVPASFVGVPVVAVLVLGVWKAILTREWGLRLDAVWPATRQATLFTLAGCGTILAAGFLRGTLHSRPDFFGNLFPLLFWGGAQQWILQTVFLREAQRVTSARAGIVVAAFLFAAMHLPNPFLTTMTLIGALGWCAIYDRYPTIVPLALSHALATLAILYAFDQAFTGRLRVGLSYLAR
jgi:membrane protease YdiL (CAAX protease family)